MKRYVHGLAMVLAFAATANAQQAAEQAQAKTDKDDPGIIAVLAVDNCFTSGSGETFLKVCITENGNISWLESPAGVVHLKMREGYAVCTWNGTGTVHGYDVNFAAAGWGPPTVSDNKRVITRTSLDGLIELKQTFTIVPAWRGVDVKMEIKNLSPVAMPNVIVARYFDGDIDGNVDNKTFHTNEASWLTWGRVLSLTVAAQTNTYVAPYSALYSEWNPLGAGAKHGSYCSSDVAASGQSGDYVGGLTSTLINIKPGQTRTLTLSYRRY